MPGTVLIDDYTVPESTNGRVLILRVCTDYSMIEVVFLSRVYALSRCQVIKMILT